MTIRHLERKKNCLVIYINLFINRAVTPMRGRGIGRAAPQRGDLFRSRPPNTSRPPSLHVDDFVALETCGQQPTGPTGYNKISMRAVKVSSTRIQINQKKKKFSNNAKFYCNCRKERKPDVQKFGRHHTVDDPFEHDVYYGKSTKVR